MSDRRKDFQHTLQSVGIAALLSGATYAVYSYWVSKNQDNCQQHQRKEPRPTTNLCPICLDAMTSKCVTFNCRHSFHQKCINQWQNISEACPICRCQLQK